VAKAYLALGETELAFDWLNCAVTERAHSMVLLKVDPQLAGIRGGARFEELVGRVFS
jgi:hypothetical protein